MRRRDISIAAASVCRNLAGHLAVLAVFLFIGHAAAVRGAVLQARDHGALAAAACLSMGDAPADMRAGHDHPPSAAGHGYAGKGQPSCCGEACLAALVPGEGPPPPEPQGAPSRSLLAALALTGHDPERPRRPPRLSPAI